MKLSISNEGLEYYRNRIQQSGQEKYDDVVQRKELLASKKISDIDYSYEIQKKAAQQNQNVDTGKSALNITDKANNYVKLDIENPIIRINTAFKGCSSLEKISVLPRIYHN